MRKRSFAKYLVSSVGASALLLAHASYAQTAEKSATAANAPVEEVVVTGSRIIREGYEAPTPLTVVGTEQLQQSANSGLISYLNDIPALAGSATSGVVNSVTGGFTGGAAANLRGLGALRTLVLLDGQRLAGANLQGEPNIAAIPQQLIERVDIVTGGASAVYGSDAVAGVINFVLNKKFTGVKGEVSGGLTNYGDDKNYKVDLSAGFGFADDRGHVIMSGEQLHNQGVSAPDGRKWPYAGSYLVVNPTYSATNGQPQYYNSLNAGPVWSSQGGIITSGPLKGTIFGPGGSVSQFHYGSINSNPMGIGGDSTTLATHQYQSIDAKQTVQNLFTQVSYEITDNVTAHLQYGWNQFHNLSNQNYYYGPGGGATSPVIKIDNAYLPASVRAAMVSTGITTFQLGTEVGDLGLFGAENTYIGNRLNPGFEGTFNAIDTTWHWTADYVYASTKATNNIFPGLVASKFLQSVDAVVNPATGAIVCRVALTDPTTTCRPWNVMGTGVNNRANASFLSPDFINDFIEKESYTASVTGEPFSLWAGPVSVAASFEHRKDSIRSATDSPSQAGDRYQGVTQGVNGAQSVTEGALETLIPLAKNESWAQSWDLSLAARFTGYELSGYVTTWKVGSTYTPIDDIKFRVTRSRDIRAPDLFDLFVSPGAVTGGNIIDRENPAGLANPTYPIRSGSIGNPALVPEKADTTGVGVVLSPKFLDGFTASVDFWDVRINGSIQSLVQQQYEDACADKSNVSLCQFIQRDPTTHLITAVQRPPINLAVQDMRGLDVEASYHMPVSNIMSDWRGNFSIHALSTFYLRNYQDNGFQVSNHVGEISSANGENGSPPWWKYTLSATYSLDPISVTLTNRGVSAVRYNSEYIECTTGCPAATAAHPTITNNHYPAKFYLDANINYKLDMGESAESEVFLSVKNMFNVDPSVQPGTSPLTSATGPQALWDTLGSVYRVGIRFKM